jgi:hypothetical protein
MAKKPTINDHEKINSLKVKEAISSKVSDDKPNKHDTKKVKLDNLSVLKKSPT